MGIFAPVVQIFVAPVLRCRHRGAVCDLVAAKLVGDQHPRQTALLLQNFLEESGRGPTVRLPLDQNVENVAVLVHRSPQILTDAADGDEHLVQVPPVAGWSLMSVQAAGALGGTVKLFGVQQFRAR